MDFLVSLPGRNWAPFAVWVLEHGYWLIFAGSVAWLLSLAFREELRTALAFVHHMGRAGKRATIDADAKPASHRELWYRPPEVGEVVIHSPPQISISWGQPEPDKLSVRLLNRGSEAVDNCKTQVIDLALWDVFKQAYRRRPGPAKVYVTGRATVAPDVFNEDLLTLPLVKHEGSKFILHSGRTPCDAVSSSTPGLWRVVLQVEDAGGSWREKRHSLFFSWDPHRKPPLRIEQDPEDKQ